MNSTARISVVAAGVALVCGPFAGTASAVTPRDPGTSVASAPSAFAMPIPALGGRCLAQYVADHMAGDRRLG